MSPPSVPVTYRGASHPNGTFFCRKNSTTRRSQDHPAGGGAYDLYKALLAPGDQEDKAPRKTWSALISQRIQEHEESLLSSAGNKPLS